MGYSVGYSKWSNAPVFSRDGSLLPSFYADACSIDAVIVSKAARGSRYDSYAGLESHHACAYVCVCVYAYVCVCTCVRTGNAL